MAEQLTKRQAARLHQEFLEAIPWVTRLKAKDMRCEGFRYGEVSRNRSKEQARCKKRAIWHFRSLRAYQLGASSVES